MHLQDQFDRILRSLHEAAFDDAVWPATAGLIDDACGLKGNHLAFGGGSVQWDTRIYFPRFCLRGQRRRDLEQWSTATAPCAPSSRRTTPSCNGC